MARTPTQVNRDREWGHRAGDTRFWSRCSGRGRGDRGQEHSHKAGTGALMLAVSRGGSPELAEEGTASEEGTAQGTGEQGTGHAPPLHLLCLAARSRQNQHH